MFYGYVNGPTWDKLARLWY